MSFNGRLNPILSLSSSASDSTGSMAMLTASNLSLNSEGCLMAMDQDNSHLALCERLATCQAALASRERTLRRLRSEQEDQLASLCRQMMSFECGLRRKQRELEMALKQRDKIIREQNLIIRFLLSKTGTKTRNISKLKSEAMSKMPSIAVEKDTCSRTVVAVAHSSTTAPSQQSLAMKNVRKQPQQSPQPSKRVNIPGQHLTTIRLNGELTSILEGSASENGGDSDSAIILDDSSASSSSASSSMKGGGAKAAGEEQGSGSAEAVSSSLSRARLKRPSRSVSDVMTVEMEDEDDEKVTALSDSGECNNKKPSTRIVKLVEEDEDDFSEDYSTVEEEDEEEEGSEDDGRDESYCSFDSSHYRGFLLRHGSFERYKSRSLKDSENPNIDKEREKVLQSDASAPSENGVVTVNGAFGSSRQIPSINHRSVTKPRDVKNRSSSKAAKLGATAAGRPGSSASVSESIKNFVEKRGSVYRSVFLDSQSEMSHSFA
jgi:hypothetical protein